MDTIKNLFTKSFIDVWTLFTNVVLNIVVAILILGIGIYISLIISKFIRKLVYLLRIDSIIEKTSFYNFFFRRGVSFSVSGFVYWIVKWTGILFSFIFFLSILNLDSVIIYLKSVSGFLIKALSAIIILFFGFYVANFLKNIVLCIGQIFSLKSAHFIAKFIQFSLFVFSFVFTVFELQISEPILRTLLTAFLALIVISGGISFGLAGKEITWSLISKVRNWIGGENRENDHDS